MGCWSHERWANKMERMQYKMERMRNRMETLRRLEEEQKEFREFLDRLRHAKDKEEFDLFMAQHRSRPTPPSDGQPQA